MKPRRSHAVKTPFFQNVKDHPLLHRRCETTLLQGCWFMCTSYSSVIEWVVTTPQVKQYGVFFNEGNTVKVEFLLCERLNSVWVLEESFRMSHLHQRWKVLQRWGGSICPLIALNISFTTSFSSSKLFLRLCLLLGLKLTTDW